MHLKRSLFVVFLFAALQVSAQKSSEVSLPLNQGSLSGTLIKAGKKEVVALIISGSGPTDRNGNNPMGVKANSYQYLAEGLAAQGISSLRYDKRGIAASKTAATVEADMRFDDLISDVKAWVKFLKSTEKFKKVVLIGHSEGALIASVAGQEPEVSALVLLSGMGRDFDVVIAEQLAKSAPKQIQEESKSIMDSLKMGSAVHRVPNYLYALYRPSVQPYLISLLKYSPTAELKKVQKPVLIVQGDADVQITVQDAKNLAATQPETLLLIIPQMDHLLKPVKDSSAPLANYQNPDLPLANQLIPAISEFILGLK